MPTTRQPFYCVLLLLLAHFFVPASPQLRWQEAQSNKISGLSPREFEIIEGIFHDGLGTFAELTLANRLIAAAKLRQPLFDLARSEAKMNDAISRLPAEHRHRTIFASERANIAANTQRGAVMLLERTQPARLVRVHHTAKEFADAKAADLRLELDTGALLPVSVKTEKSNKVAVAEGQTPDIGAKWAMRYFNVSPTELDGMMRELGFASMADLKANYLNVARLVAEVLIRKLALEDCQLNNFSRARVTNLNAAKHLFRQLRKFKHGNDESIVIAFDRTNGDVKFESLLDAIDLDWLTADRISFRPSRPRNGHAVATEFGIKIDNQAVVTFQIKHKRGKDRETERRYEFSDITTRLIL